MCSGITSASTASNAFAGFLSDGFGLGFEAGSTGILMLALGFMALVAAINFRGVGESVKANVVLTFVELSGLLMIIIDRLLGDEPGPGRLLRGHDLPVLGGEVAPSWR